MQKEFKNQEKAIRKAKIGQIYIKDKTGNVKFKDFDQMLIGDITLKQHLQNVEQRHSILLAHFQSLHEVLKDSLFINPNKRYIVVGLKNGYICKGNDYVVELTVDEKEVYKGYCMIKDYAIVINEHRKQEYIKTFEGGNL